MKKQRPPLPIPPEPREYNYGKFTKLERITLFIILCFSLIMILGLMIAYIIK